MGGGGGGEGQGGRGAGCLMGDVYLRMCARACVRACGSGVTLIRRAALRGSQCAAAEAWSW